MSSIDDLFKAHDNAQSMLGKKFVAPGEDATEEDIAEYRKAIGVPDSSDAYELKLNNEALEGQDLSKYESRARKLMHKLGIPASQANEAWNAYVQMELESVAADQAELDKRFDGLTNDLFGDQADTITQQTANFFKGVANDKTAAGLQVLQDNPAVGALVMQGYQAMQKEMADLKAKYGVEDTPAGSGEQVATGQTLDELKQQYRDVYAKGQKAKPFSSERREAEQQQKILSEKIRKLSS